jgi:hypothetical protein
MAEDLEVNQLKAELVSLRNAQSGRSVQDPRIAKRIAEVEGMISRKRTGAMTAMAKGGSVIKKSGSKAAKAGVTKFSPVKTKKLAEGGVATASKGLTKKQTAKVGKVMGEFKDKSLHSGKGGPVVKNPKQAIAIALSEARKVKKK